jgi:hypothetical protein
LARHTRFLVLVAAIELVFLCSISRAWDNAGAFYPSAEFAQEPALVVPMQILNPNYLVKLAYGRTIGTCTELDYATLEMSRRLSRRPTPTIFGWAQSEVHVAMLASYVVYYEGTVEKTRRLNFHDGYELAWIPKGRVTLADSVLGMTPYLESGAGVSYVSETFRNSGSRWNWSFIGGMGLEKCLPGNVTMSLGVQWRHLCNGNMWGKGDELHNSNSGTDILQGLASFMHRF